MAEINADILSQLVATTSNINQAQLTEIEYLKSMDATLRSLLANGQNMSAAAAQAKQPGYNQGAFGGGGSRFFRNQSASFSAASFTQSFEKTLFSAFLGSDFDSQVKGIFDKLAKDMGVAVKDIPSELGKQAATYLADAFKGTSAGKAFTGIFDDLKGKATDWVKSKYNAGKSSYTKTPSGTTTGSGTPGSPFSGGGGGSSPLDLFQKFTGGGGGGSPLGDIGKMFTGGGGGGAAGVAGAASSAGMAGVQGVAGSVGSNLLSTLGTMGPQMIAAGIALKLAAHAFGPAIEGMKKLFGSIGKAANRDKESRKKNLEYELKRMKDDVESIIRAPFEILKEAAQKVYDVWDSNLRMINATQGYNKSDLQGLIGTFADRLRSENLAAVVSATDITENLAKVLETGLSGTVAEEFAYLATKLNAAVPTQDFFNYAATYSSLAANAIRQGKSEAEAIALANKELEMFASNILYASRQISGGFTTGLTDAQLLFEQSVQISQAARTGSAANIGGVMSSVAAITGAIAPDLATAITDAVVKASTGGNDTAIVALRSLAGINASNTEFLRKIADDPQVVFGKLFENLAKMQNMANSNYMEVAEGLASVFGIPMEALARVDFQYLSQAINSMNVKSSALDSNLALLATGESTTTTEQLKMQKINELMINEGLSYVLDNQAARSIQEHMWDEQIARELMEATYAVDLRGSAMEALTGIMETIENIINLLNPLAWIKKMVNVFSTVAEGEGQEADIKTMLELGKVGKGNPNELYNLTTRNQQLNLTPDIISMLGGKSKYQTAKSNREFAGLMLTPWNALYDTIRGGSSSTSMAFKMLTDGPLKLNANSAYTWGSITKSQAAALRQANVGTQPLSPTQTKSGTVAQPVANNANFEKMLAAVGDYTGEGGGYDKWLGDARKFGIANVQSAAESAGYTEQQLQQLFMDKQVEEGKQEQARRNAREESFWDTLAFNEGNILELTRQSNKLLEDIYSKHTEFYNAWVDYFIKRVQFQATLGAETVSAIQRAEKKKAEDSVYALAEALVENNSNLLDPEVQQVKLMSQLVLIANAILQQNNQISPTMSLEDSLAANAIGALKPSVPTVKA